MIPRGVLLVVLERLGYSPNEVQRVMAAVDGEVGGVGVRGCTCGDPTFAYHPHDPGCPVILFDNVELEP